jgi:YrbI family 3-deoxy-D-manno-octulosonate 8-phosphate phosphatase
VSGSPVADPELVERIRAVRLFVFDFDGVFTDNTVYVLEDGREAVRCSRADGIGLRMLQRLEIEPLVLSTETNPVVTARCRKLGVECVQGCSDKLAMLTSLAESRGLALSALAFMGNDVNDSSCLERVGLPVIVRDAHPAVHGVARLRTRCRGGLGAVREVCDLFASTLDPSGAKTRLYA